MTTRSETAIEIAKTILKECDTGFLRKAEGLTEGEMQGRNDLLAKIEVFFASRVPGESPIELRYDVAAATLRGLYVKMKKVGVNLVVASVKQDPAAFQEACNGLSSDIGACFAALVALGIDPGVPVNAEEGIKAFDALSKLCACKTCTEKRANAEKEAFRE